MSMKDRASHKTDTTRRTLAQARRAPQWQRLIDTVHAAQAAKGYAGRQFGSAEMEFFNSRLVGMPWTTRYSADVYWVERTTFEHSDGTESVTYALKAVHAPDYAVVDRIADAVAHTTGYDGTDTVCTPEWEESTALEFVKRAAFQTGVQL